MTSSLLERLQVQDAEAWHRIVRLYYPLVREWCQRLQSEDAADVAQEVFRALSASMGRFRREGGANSFRGWLWGITQRQLLAQRRRQKSQTLAAGGTDAQKRLAELAEKYESDDEPPGPEQSGGETLQAPASERQALLRRALDLLRGEVQEHTWQAFWRVVVEGHSPADVSGALGISVNSVYLAKARLLKRLREEFKDLLD